MKYIKFIILLIFFFIFYTKLVFSAEIKNKTSILFIPYEVGSITNENKWVEVAIKDFLHKNLSNISSLNYYTINDIDTFLDIEDFKKTIKYVKNYPTEAAHILNCEYIITGKLNLVENNVTIQTDILDIKSNLIKNISVKGNINEIINLNIELLNKILDTLDISYNFLPKWTDKIEIYKEYLQSLEIINLQKDKFKDAVGILNGILDREPKFYYAQIELAKIYYELYKINKDKNNLNLALSYINNLDPSVDKYRLMVYIYKDLNKHSNDLENIIKEALLFNDNIKEIDFYLQFLPLQSLIKFLNTNEYSISLFCSVKYFNLSDLNNAIKYAKNSMNLASQNYYPYILSSYIQANLKNYKLVDKTLKLVLDKDYPFIFLNPYIGIVYLKSNNLKQAENYFKQSINICSECIFNYYFLAEIYKLQNKNKLAINILVQGLKQQPDIDLYTSLINIYISQKEYDFAEVYCKEAIVNFPNALDLYYSLADIYTFQKKYKNSLNTLKDAENLINKFYSNNNQLRVKHILKLGNIYKLQQDLNKAIQSYEKALIIAPKNIEIYNNLAEVYILTSNFPKTIEVYEKIIKLDPQNFYTYYNLGIIYMSLKNYSKAKDCFYKVIRYNPKFANAYYNLGVISWIEGNYQESANKWKQTLNIDPNHKKAKEWYQKAQEAIKLQKENSE